jgi:hypothetical protein
MLQTPPPSRMRTEPSAHAGALAIELPTEGCDGALAIGLPTEHGVGALAIERRGLVTMQLSTTSEMECCAGALATDLPTETIVGARATELANHMLLGVVPFGKRELASVLFGV